MTELDPVLTDGQCDQIAEWVLGVCEEYGPPTGNLGEFTDDLTGLIKALVTARMADAWDEGAYAAGYCCCDPEDNPYRPKEAPDA